jgi:hypothetical protein
VANYLAFSSAELANRSVDARRPAGAIVTVISELLPNCYTDFGTANLVVFRSAQDACLKALRALSGAAKRGR